jgi:hypothetical protein
VDFVLRVRGKHQKILAKDILRGGGLAPIIKIWSICYPHPQASINKKTLFYFIVLISIPLKVEGGGSLKLSAATKVPTPHLNGCL